MKNFGLLILTYVALVLESSVRTEIAVKGIAPSFLLLVVFAAVLLIDGWPALIWAALAGLLSDCLQPGQLGIDMMCATVVAYVVQRAIRGRSTESTFAIACVNFLMILTIAMASSVVRHPPAPGSDDLMQLLMPALGVAAYSAMLGLVCMTLWRFARNLLPGFGSRHGTRPSRRWNTLTP